jgi:hypothetical protein
VTVRICECGSEVTSDLRAHVDPARDTHAPSGVIEVPWEATESDPEAFDLLTPEDKALL